MTLNLVRPSAETAWEVPNPGHLPGQQPYVIERENLAERGGFEPPVELLTLQRFSKPPPSATRPSLRVLQGLYPKLPKHKIGFTSVGQG